MIAQHTGNEFTIRTDRPVSYKIVIPIRQDGPCSIHFWQWCWRVSRETRRNERNLQARQYRVA